MVLRFLVALDVVVSTRKSHCMIKEKLMNALKDAVSDYNGGMGANASVAKAAEAADFNAEQTDRLVEMFNTTAAINQFKSASDRSATCELADKPGVARMLLGTDANEKAAAFRDADYSFYVTRPDRTTPSMEARRRGLSESMHKAASASEEVVPDELNVSQRSLFKIISDKIGILKSAGEAADEAARCMRSSAEEIASNIARAIESSPRGDDMADMFKAACADQQAIDMVSKYSTKVAESSGGRFVSMNVFDTSLIDDMLKEAHEIDAGIASASECEAKRDVYLRKAAEADMEMKRAVGIEPEEKSRGSSSVSDMLSLPAKTAALVEPKVGIEPKRPESADGQSGISGILSALEKEGGVLPDVSFPVSMPSFSSDEAFSALGSLDAVDNERRRVMNARRSIILADLMTNDPIIRDADPDTIAEAYKTMVMTSPRVSLDKAQTRAFLRAAANSVAISPSDAKVIADVDKGMSLANVDRLTRMDSSIRDSNRA